MMTLAEYKKWLLKQLDYIKECEGSPHNFSRKVNFFIEGEEDDVLLELHDNGSFIFDGIYMNSAPGCGCWLDFDVYFKVSGEV